MQQVPSVRTSCRALVPCGQQLHVAGVSCSEWAGQPRSTLKGVLMKQGAPVHVLILGYCALGLWHVRAFQIASTCPHPLPGHLHSNSWACACLAAALEAWPYSLTLLHAHVPTPTQVCSSANLTFPFNSVQAPTGRLQAGELHHEAASYHCIWLRQYSAQCLQVPASLAALLTRRC